MPLVWVAALEVADTPRKEDEALWKAETTDPEGRPEGRTLPDGRGTAAAVPDTEAEAEPEARLEGPAPVEG